MDVYFVEVYEGRPRLWEGKGAWLTEVLRATPGGVLGLTHWLVLRTEADREVRRVAYAMFRHAQSYAPWKSERSKVQALLARFVGGEVRVLRAGAWLAAASLADWSVPETSIEKAEKTGLSLLEREGTGSAKILQALADFGARSRTLQEYVVRELAATLASGSTDADDSWLPRESIAQLLSVHAERVPERLVEKLEASSNPAYRMLGLRLRVVKAEDDQDLVGVIDALSDWSLHSPHHENLLAALLRNHPASAGEALPRMVQRPGAFASLLKEFMSPDVQNWRLLSRVGKALRDGLLIWDPESQKIRRP